MLNQVKIGTFIAEVRKEKGMTQKELAERLNISDKTVSKWETGKGMPDNSILLELCHVLDISVNELLSGERLSKDSYEGKAEENMMNLVKENQNNKGKGSGIGEIILGIIMLVCVYIMAIIGTGNNPTWFLDIPSFLMIFCIMVMILALTHQVRPFFKGFARGFGKGNTEEAALKDSFRAMEYAGRAATIGGIMVMITGFVAFTGHMTDVSTVGPNLAVCVLGIFYGAMFNLIILVFKALLEKRIRTV